MTGNALGTMNALGAIACGVVLLVFWVSELANGKPQKNNAVGIAHVGVVSAVTLVAIGVLQLMMEAAR